MKTSWNNNYRPHFIAPFKSVPDQGLLITCILAIGDCTPSNIGYRYQAKKIPIGMTLLIILSSV